jgi:dTDP-4-dehydrorhamnose reductase
MLNILVTGSNGQLGNEIRQLAADFSAYHFIFTDVAELDITKKTTVNNFVSRHAIDVIINAAAYTAVDKAETDPDIADLINGTAVGILAAAALKYNALFVHVSTDYVFSGKAHQPICEDDQTSPDGAYARSKLLGEQLILQENGKAVILRTSWLYSEFGGNFVKSMLKYGRERDQLKVVFDQIGSPTYARDLAKTILQLIPKWQEYKTPEVFHYSNEGVASWYDFTKAIHEIAGISCKVLPIETKDYPLPAKRPFYSVMNKDKIKKEFNLEIPYWRDSLKECIARIEK